MSGQAKIEKSDRLTICIIGGSGYVGLVTGAGLAELGHRVTCVDTNSEAVQAIQRNVLPIHEKGLPELVARNRERLCFTTDLRQGMAAAEVIFVCVGTPSNSTGETDLSQLKEALRAIAPSLNGQLLVIKSTTPPADFPALEDILRQGSGGADFEIAANPEFLREGSAVEDFFHPERIVIGAQSPKAVDTLRRVFGPLGVPVVVTSVKNAWMIKYAANAYLATRVSFINEIADLCEHIGANIDEVIKGLGYDRRIGKDYLNPGIGFGGPCLPKDLASLIRWAENTDYDPRLLRAVAQKNQDQAERIVAKARKMLGGSLSGKKVALWGLVFKPHTSDLRGSQALRIAQRLEESGTLLRAYDPMVAENVNALPHTTRCTTLY
ncbi:MAG: UDP-glucose/GDP-mannose dehydrogenase family protein, partial [Chloroflexota bacterium]|nr:UDP-glucose/GDP-mannose dehydrogenase family protein [Chloroflexota bacterium]